MLQLACNHGIKETLSVAHKLVNSGHAGSRLPPLSSCLVPVPASSTGLSQGGQVCEWNQLGLVCPGQLSQLHSGFGGGLGWGVQAIMT